MLSLEKFIATLDGIFYNEWLMKKCAALSARNYKGVICTTT